jgi:hypothetical protein
VSYLFLFLVTRLFTSSNPLFPDSVTELPINCCHSFFLCAITRRNAVCPDNLFLSRDLIFSPATAEFVFLCRLSYTRRRGEALRHAHLLAAHAPQLAQREKALTYTAASPFGRMVLRWLRWIGMTPEERAEDAAHRARRRPLHPQQA